MKLEKEDYYIVDGKYVFTETYHLKRGSCCGNGCKHCPFEPVAIKGNTKIKTTSNKNN